MQSYSQLGSFCFVGLTLIQIFRVSLMKSNYIIHSLGSLPKAALILIVKPSRCPKSKYPGKVFQLVLFCWGHRFFFLFLISIILLGSQVSRLHFSENDINSG